jgi:hypothetical protein
MRSKLAITNAQVRLQGLYAHLVGGERNLLHELIPKATNVTALVNPTDRARATAISENMQAAARTIGLQLQVLNASTDSDSVPFGAHTPAQTEL